MPSLLFQDPHQYFHYVLHDLNDLREINKFNITYSDEAKHKIRETIENQKLHRCNGKLALHVLDMIDLTMKAAQSGDKKNMRTTCGRPEIFLEDEIKKLIK